MEGPECGAGPDPVMGGYDLCPQPSMGYSSCPAAAGRAPKLMKTLLHKLPSIGVYPGMDGFDERRVRLLNAMCVLGVSASLVSLPWIFIDEDWQGLWGNLLSQLGLIGILGLQHNRKYRLAALLVNFIGLAAVSLQVFLLPLTFGIHFWLLPFLVLPHVLFFRGERWLPSALSWAAFLAFCLCVLKMTEASNQRAPELAAQILAALTLALVGRAVRHNSTEAEWEAVAQTKRADGLLHMSLPAAAVAKLKAGQTPPFEVSHGECTVLFADLVGFTRLASSRTPRDLITILDHIVSRYDACAERYGLEKIKTIGDCYMIAAGTPEPYPDHADAIASLALDLQRVTVEMAETLALPLAVRIGIHTGLVWGGVLGQNRIAFDIWGDTVNLASRLERHGVAGRIQISDETAALLSSRFMLEARGPIVVKDKGTITTHFLTGLRPD